MSRTFRCALFGIAMTVLARIGPWDWPGWPAVTVLDRMLVYAPSVVSPVQKAFGIVVLLLVNVGFWAVMARATWWACERFGICRRSGP